MCVCVPECVQLCLCAYLSLSLSIYILSMCCVSILCKKWLMFSPQLRTDFNTHTNTPIHIKKAHEYGRTVVYRLNVPDRQITNTIKAELSNMVLVVVRHTKAGRQLQLFSTQCCLSHKFIDAFVVNSHNCAVKRKAYTLFK